MPISWTSRPSALAMLWMRDENGEPFPGDPRRALGRVAERYGEMGLTPVVATELEFYLCDVQDGAPQAPSSPVTGKRLDSDGALSLDELQHFDAFLNDVYDACREQGIPRRRGDFGKRRRAVRDQFHARGRCAAGRR